MTVTDCIFEEIKNKAILILKYSDRLTSKELKAARIIKKASCFDDVEWHTFVFGYVEDGYKRISEKAR